MSNGESQHTGSGWNGPYGWKQTSKSSDSGGEESPTKLKKSMQLAGSSNDTTHRGNRERTSSKDSNEDRSKERKKRSRSPRHRDRRSRSRHRRSRSGSRRRRRSSSRSRRHRSRSNLRHRSSSKSPGKNRSDRSSRRRDSERKRSSRSRSRDRRRRSRSRGRRSSPSRKDRSRRSRSRDRRRRRSQSRSRERRRRHRSGSPSKRQKSAASRSPSPYQYGFNQAMDAQERLARRLERAKQLTKLKKEEEQQRANGFLGLKDDKLKEAIANAAKVIAGGSGSINPVQTEAMSARATAQMNALRKQAEEETGISVPSYYNPLVVNPMMFAQQQAKRNLLWSKKESESSEPTSKGQATVAWSKPALGNDKTDEKFAKLMGIKQLEQLKNPAPEEEIKKRHELFSNLDQQYEQARVVTHTQRGAGLGFASSNPNTLLAQQANQQLNAAAASYPPKT